MLASRRFGIWPAHASSCKHHGAEKARLDIFLALRSLHTSRTQADRPGGKPPPPLTAELPHILKNESSLRRTSFQQLSDALLYVMLCQWLEGHILFAKLGRHFSKKTRAVSISVHIQDSGTVCLVFSYPCGEGIHLQTRCPAGVRQCVGFLGSRSRKTLLDLLPAELGESAMVQGYEP